MGLVFFAVGWMTSSVAVAADATCPYCGSGVVEYFDWECTEDGWQLVLVGEEKWGTCGILDSWGRSDVPDGCSRSVRDIGGGGTDWSRCVWELECPMPPREECVPKLDEPWNPPPVIGDPKPQADEPTPDEVKP